MKRDTLAALAGIFWAASLFLSLGTLPPLEIERLAAVLSCLASLIPLIFCGAPLAQRHVIAPRIALAVTLLWLAAALSCAWSVSPAISLIYLGIFSPLPATILALQIADENMRRCFLRWALNGSGLVVTGLAVWTLVQVFFFPEMLNNGKVRNPFANPNAFAALLSLSFFTGFGFYLTENRPRMKSVYLFGLFLILCAFVSLASRAASAAMIVGAVVMLAAFGRSILYDRRKPLLLLALSVILTGFVIAHLPARGNIVYQMTSVASGEAPSINSRLDLWRSTLALIEQKPLLGHGYRSFYLMYPSARASSEIYSGGAMAHSDPLQLWAEIGIAGPVLFYLICLLTGWRFIKAWRPGADDAPAQACLLSLGLGCGAFIAHAHVDFLFYAMPIAMVFGLVFAELLTRTDSPVKAQQPFSFMAGWIKGADGFALTVPVIGFLALFIPLMLGEYEANNADRFLKAGDVSGFGRHVNAANTIGWGLSDRPYLMATSVPMGILQAQRGTLPAAEQAKLFNQIDGLLNKALQRNSRLAAAWHQRGMMLLALAPSIPPPDYSTAEECFSKALKINPLYLPARLQLANIYEGRGEREKTLDVLAAGLPWPYPTFAAMGYYDRTDKLAALLKKDDVRAAVEKYSALQAERLKLAADQQKSRIKTGLSTGK